MADRIGLKALTRSLFMNLKAIQLRMAARTKARTRASSITMEYASMKDPSQVRAPGLTRSPFSCASLADKEA